MGTYCSPIVADLFLFYYEGDFSNNDIDIINFVMRFQNFIGGILIKYLNIMSD